jgi:hypothetical protein
VHGTDRRSTSHVDNTHRDSLAPACRPSAREAGTAAGVDTVKASIGDRRSRGAACGLSKQQNAGGAWGAGARQRRRPMSDANQLLQYFLANATRHSTSLRCFEYSVLSLARRYDTRLHCGVLSTVFCHLHVDMTLDFIAVF